MPIQWVPEGSTCVTYRINCSTEPGVPSILAEIRRTQPVSGPTAGTVVMLTGGGGESWYGGYDAAAQHIFRELLDDGYQTIEINWMQGG
jgi:hypothetical protein